LKILVTGGAGFIGSHLVDHLMSLHEEVWVADNLSSGSLTNLSKCINQDGFNFVKSDLSATTGLKKVLTGCEVVYHLAANPEVRVSLASPWDHYKQNIKAVFNLLEAVRSVDSVRQLVFTSSSTVYGEASVIPTPEEYGPMKPISLYGASKLAGESLISGYASLYGFKALILRLGNVVGFRSNHGVISDFLAKLEKDPKGLEVLGDGNQSKSYLHVSDCISGIMHGLGASDDQVNIFNLSSPDRVNVKTIAETVAETVGAKSCKIKCTGGVDGGRGWPGDVKMMQLSVDKMLNTGWKPKYNSHQAIQHAARELYNV